MKTKNLQRLVMATALTSVLFACKKNNDNNSSSTSNADLQTQADDENRVSNETDAAFDDINTAMTNQTSVTGSSVSATVRYGVETEGGPVQDTVQTNICGAVVTVDTMANPRTITITYNGKTCDLLRSRSGSVVISFAPGTRWVTANSQVNVAFNNLTITRLFDNKSITLNGTHTYTNVSGGSLGSLNANSTTKIIHTITSSNMSITFDNGTQRTWNIARQRTYSFSSGLVVSTEGTHTDGGTTGISEWGTNRFGNSFTTSIVSPLVIKAGCGWQMTSGEAKLANSAGTTDLTFGLDATGASIGCPVSGTYYFKLIWTGNGGKSYTFILPY
jgi:hypothetical protein